ncbi:hypothetical protein B0J11DRAFT_327696 [Dendryphion nanum]|uniref:Secreted protein n=1 Tax=Dendryphion nanum TaxID=256645 RepID=A0A9P9IKN9_9PLEO|nr:hypothetical protein B0J11DRAFT_327696 [Dendryphion nanum]
MAVANHFHFHFQSSLLLSLSPSSALFTTSASRGFCVACTQMLALFQHHIAFASRILHPASRIRSPLARLPKQGRLTLQHLRHYSITALQQYNTTSLSLCLFLSFSLSLSLPPSLSHQRTRHNHPYLLNSLFTYKITSPAPQQLA